jgi:transposase-like protein
MVNHDRIRNQKWRLGFLRHFEEVTHNVSKTCRYFGISRNAFYKWQRRYVELGEAGLLDCSRCQLHSLRATNTEILAKII